MIDLENFLKQYNTKKAKDLLHQDPQFLALQDCRNHIAPKDENLFLFLVIQCALVSYQIAWSGEQWRTEFGQKVQKNWDILLDIWKNNQNNTDRRFNFLKTSKNNKRIYNIKKSRIEKINTILQTEKNFFQFQNKLEELNNLLAKTMKTTLQSKTIVFATKMFGYACTIITWKDTIYPMSINIPIDSRIKKIYLLNTKNTQANETEICKYFQNLSQTFQISPLDLDTILRLDYWKIIKQN